MQLSFDLIVQTCILLVAIFGLVIPLHRQNREAARKQRKMAKKAWKAIQQHIEECHAILKRRDEDERLKERLKQSQTS